MLHKETVDASTLELLKQMMADRRLKDFVLVGGTALSLQMGHRISVDLDLFVNQDFEAEELREYMERNYYLETDYLAFCDKSSIFVPCFPPVGTRGHVLLSVTVDRVDNGRGMIEV